MMFCHVDYFPLSENPFTLEKRQANLIRFWRLSLPMKSHEVTIQMKTAKEYNFCEIAVLFFFFQ